MAKTALNFVARFQAKPGRADDMETILTAIIAPTRAEPGCVNYDLHRRVDDPSRFLLYEGWESQAALDYHMTLPHFTKLVSDLKDGVAEIYDDGKPFQGEPLRMLTDRKE